MMYCNHHFHFPLALFHVSKLKLRELTPNSPFPPPPISWQLLLYPPFLWPRPFLALYINGLMCFSFCVSLSIMTSRFIQGVACVRTTFLFKAEQPIFCSLSVHPSMDYWIFFCLLAIVKHAAISEHKHLVFNGN